MFSGWSSGLPAKGLDARHAACTVSARESSDPASRSPSLIALAVFPWPLATGCDGLGFLAVGAPLLLWGGAG